jgi:hypothetical protein
MFSAIFLEAFKTDKEEVWKTILLRKFVKSFYLGSLGNLIFCKVGSAKITWEVCETSMFEKYPSYFLY